MPRAEGTDERIVHNGHTYVQWEPVAGEFPDGYWKCIGCKDLKLSENTIKKRADWCAR